MISCKTYPGDAIPLRPTPPLHDPAPYFWSPFSGIYGNEVQDQAGGGWVWVTSIPLGREDRGSWCTHCNCARGIYGAGRGGLETLSLKWVPDFLST